MKICLCCCAPLRLTNPGPALTFITYYADGAGVRP